MIDVVALPACGVWHPEVAQETEELLKLAEEIPPELASAPCPSSATRASVAPRHHLPATPRENTAIAAGKPGISKPLTAGDADA